MWAVSYIILARYCALWALAWPEKGPKDTKREILGSGGWPGGPRHKNLVFYAPLHVCQAHEGLQFPAYRHNGPFACLLVAGLRHEINPSCVAPFRHVTCIYHSSLP